VTIPVRRQALAVVLVALLVRGLALWAGSDATPVLDEVGYAMRARELLDGRGFLGSYQTWVRHSPDEGRPNELPQYPGAWQPPGYVAFVAGVMAVSGGSVTAVKAVQVLLGTAAVALVLAMATSWFGARAGLAAGWVAALYPNLVAFTHYLWSETLFVFLLLASLHLLTRRLAPVTPATALAAGALLGLAALTRATIVYLLPVLALWLAWVGRARLRTAVGGALLVCVAAALVILPWSVRNTRLHGGFVLIDTNAPYNLWRGNGPGAFEDRCAAGVLRYRWPFDCIPVYPVGNRYGWGLVAEAKEALGSDAPSDLEIVGHARDAAWREIRGDPALFVRRMGPRLVDMWNPTSFLVRHLRIGAYGPVHPLLELAVSWTAMLCYLLVVALAAAGAWRQRRDPRVWLVLALMGLLCGVTALAFGLTRFRLPLMPLLIVLGAPALASLGGRRRAANAAASGLLLALAGTGCGPGEPPARTVPGPNLLWVVWDTVRADRLSLHGHERQTTPRLDAWARGARVFENARSPAGYTLPSHASMFTGLLPSEHCAHNGNQVLDERFTTLAEHLREAGYQTFLFSANPHVSGPPRNLAQGFETVEHPWSPRWSSEAERIVRAKLPERDRSSELRERLESAQRGLAPLTAWNIKAAGELAERAVLAWLEASDPRRPWLVFVNYMEAHRPMIPPRRYRERMMSAGEVEASYRVDRSWLPMWEYTFGLREYDDEELALTRATYDATLAELDDHFASLLAALEDAGRLEDTVVVLTSDHGEHLGEQHMLDHQYSLYEPLLRVPLVVHYPARFQPGRDARPVANFDLFPTLLELAGLEVPEGVRALSLLSPRERRPLLAEEPAVSQVGIGAVRRAHPDWDPSPWERRLRAWTDGPWKYLVGSDGRHELYDLARDPGEAHDLRRERPDTAKRLAADLERFAAELSPCEDRGRGPRAAELDEEERERLRALGYLPEDASPE
jgi:arylsulfatase A-like enzyme/4-amino-4-deoxy-L-arabinose transferase-like glycosyltransferase